MSPSLFDEMLQLSECSWEIGREALAAKIKGSDIVAIARNRSGVLKAMALIDSLQLADREGAYRVICTSHVYTAPDVRGGVVLHRFGVRSVMRERLRFPATPLYWFFVAGNIRSFLLMARNFQRYWPHPSRVDAVLERRMAQVARQIIPRPRNGHAVPSDAQGNGAIRDHEKRIPEVTGDVKPLVDHFLRLNPGYGDGDGLLCFCPLDWPNLGGMVRRMARKSLSPGAPLRRVERHEHPRASPPNSGGASGVTLTHMYGNVANCPRWIHGSPEN